MVEVFITYNKRAEKLEISFKPEREITHVRYECSFAKKRELNRAEVFLKTLERISAKSARLRREKNAQGLREANQSAAKRIREYGSRLFDAITKDYKGGPIDEFKDLFGEIEKDFSLILNLDPITRRFPWELANDGVWPLFQSYDVGRAVVTPNKPIDKVEGLTFRKALVVGLNYSWLGDEDMWLETPEKEAKLVGKRLRDRFGYTVKLLLGEDATLENLIKYLSKGVDVFHFSGHGSYDPDAPEGFQGSLVLYNDEDPDYCEPSKNLTEGWLDWCFGAAGRAPWFSFLNACQSAKEIYSSHMIDEFISYGATHVVGTMWSIFDEPAYKFVLGFYDQVAKGKTIGHALQLTRWSFNNERRNDEVATWPSFILYGNPEAWFKHAP